MRSRPRKSCAPEKDLRFTPLRQRVLELVWSSHKPVGAYALLDQLRDEDLGSAPPTIYRALDFLIEHGLIHRIERMNAFIGCSHPGEAHRGFFLICGECGNAEELDSAGLADFDRLHRQSPRLRRPRHDPGSDGHLRRLPSRGLTPGVLSVVRPVQPFEAFGQVGLEILDVLEADMDAQHVLVLGPRHGRAVLSGCAGISRLS